MDARKDRPIEFFVVATNVHNGAETWFRTAHIQGFSLGQLADAFRTGRVMEGCTWRKVPVSYRLVTELGDELHARWNAGKKAFVLDNGMLFSRKWCYKIEEIVEDGDV